MYQAVLPQSNNLRTQVDITASRTKNTGEYISIIFQASLVQRGANKFSRIRIVCTNGGTVSHAMPPTLRGLSVNPAKDNPSIPIRAFYDCGAPIGVTRDNKAPSCKLRSVLPILIQSVPTGDVLHFSTFMVISPKVM